MSTVNRLNTTWGSEKLNWPSWSEKPIWPSSFKSFVFWNRQSRLYAKECGSSKMSHIHRSSDFIRLRRLRRNLLYWDILQPQLRWAWLETHDALQGWVTRTRWCDPLQFSTFYNAKQSLQLYYRITTVQLHYTTQMSMLCLLLPCWASVLFDFESFLSGKKRMEETSLLTEGYDSSDAFVEVGLNGCIWEGLLFAFALGLL